MQLSRRQIGRSVIAVTGMAVFTLVLAMAAPNAGAQTTSDAAKQEGAGLSPMRSGAQEPVAETVETIFLANAPQQHDLNDIQTDLRNVLPRTKIYGVQTQNAITLRGTPEDLATAHKLIADLDRPKPMYRLTYTITNFDGGKRTGSHNFVVLAVLGQRSIFKEGSRVPIVTGSYNTDARNSNTQVQYQDIGVNIDATIDGSADGLTLRAKVEQSSVANEKSATAPQDPVIQQTVFQETAELKPGKPIMLGEFDTAGAAQHEQVEVTAELVQ